MNKKHLKITISPGDICFDTHEQYNLSCQKTSCRQWFDNSETQNCVILAARKGPEKQERIGKYFDLTRMRVCQIEKNILAKIRGIKQLKEKLEEIF